MADISMLNIESSAQDSAEGIIFLLTGADKIHSSSSSESGSFETSEDSNSSSVISWINWFCSLPGD